MRSLLFLPVLFLLNLPGLLAQSRYLDVITDSVVAETYTYVVKDGKKLDLDVYFPATDSEQRRPVFLYVHGGGFSGGTRNSVGIKDFCRKIAQRGYVAVSISYRLTRAGTKTGFGCDCEAREKLATFAAAVEDLHDATRFIAGRGEQFGIDPERIILAGSSAGAETVLDAVYDQPLITTPQVPAAYAGVISMAGAIPDTAKITDDRAIPSMFFHGTCDNLVPYGKASHRYCKPGQPGYLVLDGGQVIAEKLRRLGKPYWLHTTCGGDHALAGTPMTRYFDEMLRFCYDFVLNGKRDQIHTIIPGDHPCEYPAYNYCSGQR